MPHHSRTILERDRGCTACRGGSAATTAAADNFKRQFGSARIQLNSAIFIQGTAQETALKVDPPRKVVRLDGRQRVTIATPGRLITPAVRPGSARSAILGHIIKPDAIQLKE
ncbi:hypothetical protein [Leisingera sp. HS039]|uniref:hypothetical protein n=1 Tax=Leisingera sp. HS039 TaxID=2818496 RepID=UPI001B3A554E|nr:hypothetical protein [Leisingera sp. HS039]